MQVIKVRKADAVIVNDILQNHVDDTDRRATATPNINLDKLLDDNGCYLFAAIDNDAVIGYALAYRFPSL